MKCTTLLFTHFQQTCTLSTNDLLLPERWWQIEGLSPSGVLIVVVVAGCLLMRYRRVVLGILTGISGMLGRIRKMVVSAFICALLGASVIYLPGWALVVIYVLTLMTFGVYKLSRNNSDK